MSDLRRKQEKFASLVDAVQTFVSDESILPWLDKLQLLSCCCWMTSLDFKNAKEMCGKKPMLLIAGGRVPRLQYARSERKYMFEYMLTLFVSQAALLQERAHWSMLCLVSVCCPLPTTLPLLLYAKLNTPTESMLSFTWKRADSRPSIVIYQLQMDGRHLRVTSVQPKEMRMRSFADELKFFGLQSS